MSAHALVELATSVALLAGICCRLDALCRGRGAHPRGLIGRAQQPGHSRFCHWLRTHDGAGRRSGLATSEHFAVVTIFITIFLSRILGIKEFSYSCHCSRSVVSTSRFSYSCHCSRSVVSTSRFSQIKNLSKSVDICVLNSAWQQSFTLNTLSTQNDRFMSLLSDNLCVNIFAISLRFGWRCATLVTSLRQKTNHSQAVRCLAVIVWMHRDPD